MNFIYIYIYILQSPKGNYIGRSRPLYLHKFLQGKPSSQALIRPGIVRVVMRTMVIIVCCLEEKLVSARTGHSYN